MAYGCETPALRRFRTRYENTVTDPIHDFRNQAQVDTRANLFYFLRNMQGLTDDRGRLPNAECTILDDQINPQPNRLVL
jgi:hypothetical protein